MCVVLRYIMSEHFEMYILLGGNTVSLFCIFIEHFDDDSLIINHLSGFCPEIFVWWLPINNRQHRNTD